MTHIGLSASSEELGLPCRTRQHRGNDGNEDDHGNEDDQPGSPVLVRVWQERALAKQKAKKVDEKEKPP